MNMVQERKGATPTGHYTKAAKGSGKTKTVAHRSAYAGTFLSPDAVNTGRVAEALGPNPQPAKGGVTYHQVATRKDGGRAVMIVGDRATLGRARLAPPDDAPPRAERPAPLTDAEVAALPEGAPLPPVTPGEILLEEFIRPHGLSPIKTAQRLGVPRTRIERLVAGETRLTEDTALRLEALFGATAEFWLQLQLRHDLEVARRTAGPSIAAIERLEGGPGILPSPL